VGQKTISTRWIITEKLNHGKRICKARLVAQGFEEQKENNRTDAPTCSAEILKSTIALINFNGWECKTIDIKTAYLQGENIERKVYLKPPREARCKKIWKLRKAVYGLRDAARTWYESLVKLLKNMGGKRSIFEPTLFYWKKKGKLWGVMCTHVDDLLYGGNKDFENYIIEKMKKKIQTGLEEEKSFKYVGIQVDRKGKNVIMNQNKYVQSIEEPEIKQYRDERELTREEMKQYRGLVGQLNWISQHTRPELSFEVSNLSKSCKKGTTRDMRKLIKTVKRAKELEGNIVMEKINKEGIEFEVYADASFNNVGDGNSQIGYIV